MPHRQNHKTMPATREPASLLSVDRAVFELRRGRMVCVAAADGVAALVMAAEGTTPQALADLQRLAGQPPVLAITRRRARSEEHTSELQSHHDLVCRLLLEKKNKKQKKKTTRNHTDAHEP